MGNTAFLYLDGGLSPRPPSPSNLTRDLENASPFLESHESHVEEGKSYDFD